MITLRVVEPSWITGASDDPSDHCAHGRVLFEISGTRLVSPEDGEWAVSAAGLFLLRTLTADNTGANRVSEGNYLFPCCGQAVYVADASQYGFVCMGCPNGKEVDVVHVAGRVHFSADGHGGLTMTEPEWTAAVLAFCAQVREFYAKSRPKIEMDPVEVDGWRLFWQEWRTRVALAAA